MTREFPNLRLRPATLDDAKMLLEWRNDPLTRKNSRNQDIIAEAAHIAWLTRYMGSKEHLLYIAEDNALPVGTVRADRGKESTELSWTVAPVARGKGYGKAMLLKFVHEIIPHEPITATIEEGNIASEAIAKALGLKKHGPEEPRALRAFIVWKK